MELRPRAQTKAHSMAATMTIRLKSKDCSWVGSWQVVLMVGLRVGGWVWAMKRVEVQGRIKEIQRETEESTRGTNPKGAFWGQRVLSAEWRVAVYVMVEVVAYWHGICLLDNPLSSPSFVMRFLWSERHISHSTSRGIVSNSYWWLSSSWGQHDLFCEKVWGFWVELGVSLARNIVLRDQWDLMVTSCFPSLSFFSFAFGRFQHKTLNKIEIWGYKITWPIKH